MAVTVNISNAFDDNSQWNASGGYWDINVRTNDGYVFDGDVEAVYTTTSGYMRTTALDINDTKDRASGKLSDTDADTKITIIGATSVETPELNVVNSITGSNVTEQHTFDGKTATFTVTGNYNPDKVRFFDLKASYTNKAGTSTETPFTVNDLENSQEATATITDVDPSKTVTLTGSYERVIKVNRQITLCTANDDLPQYVRGGDTINATLTANEGAEFDTKQSKPVFSYVDYGEQHQVELTVSQDNKTASGSLLINADFSDLSIIGTAYAVEVVGQQYGAINVYLVTLDELAEFSAKRFFKETGTDPSTGAIIYENIDLGAYVNKIRRIYTNIRASVKDVIRCGNYNTGVSCLQPGEDKITLEFGVARVPAHNDDTTDFESEFQVFLPFAGFVNLNSDYAGQTISLEYVINVVTGNGVALLYSGPTVFQVVEIEPSSEIIYLSPSTQVKTVGGDDWNEMLYYGLEPYIYCKWYESASNGRNNDRHTGEIGDFKGFNIFDDVTPIHTAEMLTEEQEMIYTALSDGVYIE